MGNWCEDVGWTDGDLMVDGQMVTGPGRTTPSTHFGTIDVSGISSSWSSGNFQGSFYGGVLAPNGNIFFLPYDVRVIFQFDPSEKCVTAQGVYSQQDCPNYSIDIQSAASWSSYGDKYGGGVLATNGKIYGVPRYSNNVGEISPDAFSFTAVDISSKLHLSSGWYSAGVLAPNGKVYFAPKYASNIGEFNPSTNSFITRTTCAGCNWHVGGILAPNGKIYFVPGKYKITFIDPSSIDDGNFASSIDIADVNPAGVQFNIHTHFYKGGVLAPNGKIYFVPSLADNILVLDPFTHDYTTIDISSQITGDDKYFGGVLASNGIIYFVPYNANNIGVLDPSTHTFTTIDICSNDAAQCSNAKYCGGVFADGKVFFVPFNTNKIGVLTLGNSTPAYEVVGGVPEAWRALLSPHFNKL